MCAENGGEFAACRSAQGDRPDEEGFTRRGRCQQGDELGLRRAVGQELEECFDGCGVVVVAAGELAAGGGDPLFAGDEIEVESGELAGVGQAFEAFFGSEAGALGFLALGDVGVDADHALQRAVRSEELDAGRLHPDVVSETMAQTELDGEVAVAGGRRAGNAVGKGGGIVGVDQTAPGVRGVGQRLGIVAEHAFPSG